jgi:hypothetical protein
VKILFPGNEDSVAFIFFLEGIMFLLLCQPPISQNFLAQTADIFRAIIKDLLTRQDLVSK